MKKKLLSIALISSFAMASNFYVGGGANVLGADSRNYDNDYNTIKVKADRNDYFVVLGYEVAPNRNFELEYRTIKLKNKHNSSDKSTVTSIGVNFILHRQKPVWRLMPYLKSSISYVHNNTQYSTKKGANGAGFGVAIGTYIQVTKKIDLSVDYEVRALIYQKVDGINTTDLARGVNMGVYYHF